MKRTTVFVDEDDLAVIKADAARLGQTEAEIIREALHLAAMARRHWDEPFFSDTYVPLQADPGDIWADKVAVYERTKLPRR